MKVLHWTVRKVINLLDRIGRRRGMILMALAAVAIAMSLQPFLGTDGWAGLGQWAGGLGAFFAAWAALNIAKQEARRENDRDAETRRVHAYYVSGRHGGTGGPKGIKMVVENAGKEPVLAVKVVAIHAGPTRTRWIGISTNPGVHDALLPGASCDVWVQPHEPGERNLIEGVAVDVEIAFTDLGGTRWSRIGDRPPTVNEAN